MYGRLFGCCNWGGGYYWLLVAEGQGCCESSQNTQTAPATENDPDQNVNRAKSETTYSLATHENWCPSTL